MPPSVTMLTGSFTTHRSLRRVVTKAVLRPLHMAQPFFDLSSCWMAVVTIYCIDLLDSRSFQIAVAHSPIGKRCASNAGSAWPLSPSPLANMRASSRLWPPVPLAGAAIAAAILRWPRSMELETPKMQIPYVMAYFLQVRKSMLVSIPTFLSTLNRWILAASP